MSVKRMGLFLVAFCLSLQQMNCSHRGKDIGSASNPIRFYFMPLKDIEVFEANAPLIKRFIEENTPLHVKTIAAPDFITIIKAFHAKAADAAFMNTLGYMTARDWSKAEAHLRLLYGEGEALYRGALVARVESNLQSISDLAGKKIVLPDRFSASGYLYTLKLLEAHNVKPSKVVFAKGHLDSLKMVYQGQADAAAIYYEKPTAQGEARDARIELVGSYPDVLSKIKIVALTDEIPTGPVVLRSNLPASVKTQLVGALVEWGRTEEGKQTLKNLYNATGLVLATDKDYDSVATTLKKLGKESEEMVEGGVTFYKNYVGVGFPD